MQRLFVVFLFSVSIAFLSVQLCQAADNVPQTLDEAFSILDSQLSTEQREQFRSKPEEQAVTEAHHGLGAWIRNTWFRNNATQLTKTLRDLCARHFDDLSTIILTSYWRYLNKRPIEPEARGKFYRQYWEANKGS